MWFALTFIYGKPIVITTKISQITFYYSVFMLLNFRMLNQDNLTTKSNERNTTSKKWISKLVWTIEYSYFSTDSFKVGQWHKVSTGCSISKLKFLLFWPKLYLIKGYQLPIL